MLLNSMESGRRDAVAKMTGKSTETSAKGRTTELRNITNRKLRNLDCKTSYSTCRKLT
jgi:hypothetical protein